ncbi:MAG: hypothetical protein HC884_18410 [Chloroflexaceae bacterium]|nr:hypothetical protein [Chloroflexaceae bacterium]
MSMMVLADPASRPTQLDGRIGVGDNGAEIPTPHHLRVVSGSSSGHRLSPA